MPNIPASGPISLHAIQTAIGIATASLSKIYEISSYLGNHGLMYHNLNMGPGNNLSAADAIWSTYISNSTYSVKNWYNYDPAPDFFCNYSIQNNSSYEVQLSLRIFDSSNNVVATIFSGIINAGGFTSGNSIGPSVGTIGYNGYRICLSDVTFTTTPPPNVTYNIVFDVSGNDLDGVGPGSNRTSYTPLSYQESGPGGPFYPPTPYGDQLIMDDNGDTIAINKRTTVNLIIN
jgi:hypothetical protein